MLAECYRFFAIVNSMNRKQQKIQDAVFTKPTLTNIEFSDLEKLVEGLGGEVIEGSGSRVKIILNRCRVFRAPPASAKRSKEISNQCF